MVAAVPVCPTGPGSAPVGATASNVHSDGLAVPPWTSLTRVNRLSQVTTLVTVKALTTSVSVAV